MYIYLNSENYLKTTYEMSLPLAGTSSAWDRCLSLQPLGQYNLSQEVCHMLLLDIS